MKHHRFSTKAVTLFIIIIGSLLFVPCSVTAEEFQPAALLSQRMKPLDKIQPTWSQKLPAEKRFLLVLDGEAVLDRETGLVWERSLATTGRTWNDAVFYCYSKEVGGRKGWRLPTIEELASLVDTTLTNPSLPSGHPFVNVQSGFYWSSTELVRDSENAWYVRMDNGGVFAYIKSNLNKVWAVRGGQ